jgi:quercetin dioxygenase-like cupin family protein
MEKFDNKFVAPPVLDEDILLLLAESQEEVELPPALNARMRHNILTTIAQEEAGILPGFKTIRAAEGEWIEAMPGAHIKILHQEGDSGLLTYLARLAPGFEMPGHPHPFDEECIMLEGELWFGDLHLKAGDYHFAAKGVHHGRLKTETGALAFLKGALPA